MTQRRLRGRLVWQLYIIGFLQVVVLGAAVAGVGWLWFHIQASQEFPSGTPSPPPRPMRGHLPRHPPTAPLVIFLASGLLIVGVGSFLTARRIVRPLEVLSRAARALGSGDLQARTGLKRKDEIGDMGRAFDEMADRLQALLMAERELLANVSHELRTPIARIRVALELAGDGDNEAARMSLAEIHTDLAELELLISDIMTAARLDVEHGRAPTSGFSLHLERLSPLDICERAAERFGARCPGRFLVVENPEHKVPMVDADPVLFRRVLDNLLENADKYSPNRERILLRTSAADDRVTFEIVDRGMGIPEQDLPRIFTPFFRGERSRSRAGGGVGLGLTLVRRIVEAHNGAVDVSSATGRGTTVRVSLPVAPEVAQS